MTVETIDSPQSGDSLAVSADLGGAGRSQRPAFDHSARPAAGSWPKESPGGDQS
jgi:hypothetical protein